MDKSLNNKYKTLNDNIFNSINSEEKAYLLGWIISNGIIHYDNFTIKTLKKHKEILEKLQDILCKDKEIPLIEDNINIYLTIYSTQIIKDLYTLLQIDYIKDNTNTPLELKQFPQLNNDGLIWTFIRGYFDGNSSISLTKYKYPMCSINCISECILNYLSDYIKIKYSKNNNSLEFYGYNCIDFLDNIYSDATIYMESNYQKYINVLSIQTTSGCIPFAEYTLESDAIAPYKSRASDVGYDLTLIRKIKQVGKVEYYTTGVRISPMCGYYFDLVPRSSISKLGYMLANSVGIIDGSYRGPLIVPLIKIDDKASDLELPLKCCQLIPRRYFHFNLLLVDSLEETDRNEGGFGSTDISKKD